MAVMSVDYESSPSNKSILVFNIWHDSVIQLEALLMLTLTWKESDDSEYSCQCIWALMLVNLNAAALMAVTSIDYESSQSNKSILVFNIWLMAGNSSSQHTDDGS